MINTIFGIFLLVHGLHVFANVVRTKINPTANTDKKIGEAIGMIVAQFLIATELYFGLRILGVL